MSDCDCDCFDDTDEYGSDCDCFGSNDATDEDCTCCCCNIYDLICLFCEPESCLCFCKKTTVHRSSDVVDDLRDVDEVRDGKQILSKF